MPGSPALPLLTRRFAHAHPCMQQDPGDHERQPSSSHLLEQHPIRPNQQGHGPSQHAEGGAAAADADRLSSETIAAAAAAAAAAAFTPGFIGGGQPQQLAAVSSYVGLTRALALLASLPAER